MASPDPDETVPATEAPRPRRLPVSRAEPPVYRPAPRRAHRLLATTAFLVAFVTVLVMVLVLARTLG